MPGAMSTPSQHPGPRPVKVRAFGGLRALATTLIMLIVVNVGVLGWLTTRATKNKALAEPSADRVVPIELNIAAPSKPPPEDLTDQEKRTIEIFRQAAPSVVFITTLQLRNDLLRRNVMALPRGTGSGFIWDDQGHIVTNFHVIREGNAARVTFTDQETYDAKLVGYAADKDLAVLKVDAPREKLRPLPRGSSSELNVGQQTLAIGNPFGLDHTLSSGVVSGLEREIESLAGRPIFGVIQTDAAINPGNSGGPLLDSRGRLIGINTAIYSPSGASAGIGFAVPIDPVERFVPQLIEHGRIIRPGLGIQFDQRINDRLGRKGIVVLGVQPDSGAEKAGLRPTKRDPDTGRIVLGDIIVKIDGEEVGHQKDLFKVLDDKRVGDEVTITLKREGEEMDLVVKLTALDGPEPSPRRR
jgi:S1-C subfamily serine protease